MTASEYEELRTVNRRQGYRPVWVDVYGRGPDRRYAAIWLKDGQKVEWEDAHDLDKQAMDEKWKTVRAQGYAVLIESHYISDAGDERSAVLWNKTEGGWGHWYGGGYEDLNRRILGWNVTCVRCT